MLGGEAVNGREAKMTAKDVFMFTASAGWIKVYMLLGFLAVLSLCFLHPRPATLLE